MDTIKLKNTDTRAPKDFDKAKTKEKTEEIMAPNAAPMITAMARSIIFPFRANSLNSLSIPIIDGFEFE